jgi:hypothetical protein
MHRALRQDARRSGISVAGFVRATIFSFEKTVRPTVVGEAANRCPVQLLSSIFNGKATRIPWLRCAKNKSGYESNKNARETTEVFSSIIVFGKRIFMAQDAMNQMKFDKSLEKTVETAATFAELQEILHTAIERSPELGITRDVETGRFIPREKEPPAATKTADAAPRTFEKKGVVIAGKSFDFSAPSELELARQIASANEVAAALASDESVTPRAPRAVAARNAEQDVLDRVDADMALRRGDISTAEYLERTHAIEDALAAKGVDVEALGAKQFEESWASATTTFLQGAGASWPGGTKNRALLGDKLAAMGLTDAADKVAALAAAYEALKNAGTLFDGDFSQAQVEAMTDKASPQEILQAWKESVQPDVHGDATEANEAFIEIHRRSGSPGLFNRCF